MDADVVLEARARLGEGPVWDAREGVLRWVDIVPGLVHRLDPATGEDTAFEFGEQVGTVPARAGGGLVLGTESGIWTCATDGSDRRRLHEVGTDPPGGRCNDVGGPDLSTLYITSAAIGLSDPDARAGAVFACAPGVRGQPAGEWAG